MSLTRYIAPSDVKKKRLLWFEMSADELLDAIGMRDTATIMHMRNPDPDTKAKLATARKYVKRVVNEAKNRWMLTKLEEIFHTEDGTTNSS
jgi:hypothetical protein